MAGNEHSGPKPAKMKMADVTRIVGGVTRGTRQKVRKVSIDADGKMELTMDTGVNLRMDAGVGPLRKEKTEPAQLDLDDALADTNQEQPEVPVGTEQGL